MKPVHRNKRILRGLFFTSLVIVGASLLLSALGDNKQLFVNPDTVLKPDFNPSGKPFRVGGLVMEDSLQKLDALTAHFSIVNFDNPDDEGHALAVQYHGVLPDLFREGQGVVVLGVLDSSGVMKASNVLAKHDENYQPKMAVN